MGALNLSEAKRIAKQALKRIEQEKIKYRSKIDKVDANHQPIKLAGL